MLKRTPSECAEVADCLQARGAVADTVAEAGAAVQDQAAGLFQCVRPVAPNCLQLPRLVCSEKDGRMVHM